MNKVLHIFHLISVCVLAAQSFIVHSSEKLIDASVSSSLTHNDNLFLVDDPESAISDIIITPIVSGIIRERNWEAKLNAKLRINKYSRQGLDSNDQFFSLFGRYQMERNIFSLTVGHDLANNLSSTSDDFGLARKRIKRKSQSVAPTYTRLLTERATLSLTYVYSDVDFLDAENTSFTPYITHTARASLQYRLTEKNNLSLSFRVVDYESKNKLSTYKLLTTNLGIDHEFSETLSSRFEVGVSSRTSTDLRTEEVDFFGGTIPDLQVLDAKSRGLLFNIGLTQLLESGNINANISRNDSTNSSGGINTTESLALNYTNRVSALWRYDVNGRYADIESVNASSAITDRQTFTFESIARYSISPDWNFSVSYQYSARKFSSNTSEGRSPHSNRVSIGLLYNFPPLSTF